MSELNQKEKAAFVRVQDLLPIIERLKELGQDVSKLGLPQTIIGQLEDTAKNAKFIQAQKASSAALIIKGFTQIEPKSRLENLNA